MLIGISWKWKVLNCFHSFGRGNFKIISFHEWIHFNPFQMEMENGNSLRNGRSEWKWEWNEP
jgi:hypothetical protein